MHCSDQIITATPAATDELTSPAGQGLTAVADHLATVRPEADLKRMELSMCVGAEAYFLDGRRIGRDSSRIADAATAMLPAAPRASAAARTPWCFARPPRAAVGARTRTRGPSQSCRVRVRPRAV